VEVRAWLVSCIGQIRKLLDANVLHIKGSCQNPHTLPGRKSRDRRDGGSILARTRTERQGDRLARILVIDDERSIREALKKLFERLGYEVDVAENGEVGLQLYRARRPDLVVTDMTMPVKGGLQTLAELKRDYPRAKVIAMSGGWPESALDPLMVARDLGADRTLEKPFDIQDMLCAVAGVLALDGRGSEGSACGSS
jgi:CheY-like chemotaxis protein